MRPSRETGPRPSLPASHAPAQPVPGPHLTQHRRLLGLGVPAVAPSGGSGGHGAGQRGTGPWDVPPGAGRETLHPPPASRTGSKRGPGSRAAAAATLGVGERFTAATGPAPLQPPYPDARPGLAWPAEGAPPPHPRESGTCPITAVLIAEWWGWEGVGGREDRAVPLLLSNVGRRLVGGSSGRALFWLVGHCAMASLPASAAAAAQGP